MLMVLASSLLAGLPPLTPLEPPLALFPAAVVQDTAVDGVGAGDVQLVFGGAQCPTRAISVMRSLSASLTMIERVQQWLDANPGAEGKLFKQKGTLGEVLSFVSAGGRSPQHPCQPQKPVDGWKLNVDAAPKLCEVAAPASEAWFLSGASATSAVRVSSAAAQECQPRVSVALFDAKGKTRVRLHADFSAAMSATLLGDGCRIELSWDVKAQRFKGQWKACKG